MVYLKDIYAQRELIKEIAVQLGFKELRLLFFDDNTLSVLVSINREYPNANADNAILLESKLIKLFQCRSAVIVESKLKPLEKESILKNAILIDDITKFEKLAPHDLYFKPIELSRFENMQLNRKNRLADNIISLSSNATIFKNNAQNLDDKMKKLSIEVVPVNEKNQLNL